MWVFPTGCALLVPFSGAAQYILLETTGVYKGAIGQTVQQQWSQASSDSFSHACATTTGKTNQVKKQSLMHTFYGVDTLSSIVRSQLRNPPVKRQSPFQFNAPSGADVQTTSPSTITVDLFVLPALKRAILNDRTSYMWAAVRDLD